MSHAFDLTCFACTQKFCECHDSIYFDDETFCSEKCKEEYFDAHITCTREKACQHLEDFWVFKKEKGLSDLNTDEDKE